MERDATPPEMLVVAAPLWIEARAVRRAAPHLRVVRTGAGPERARRAAARLRRDPARALAVAGLCGALDPRLAPGDVLVASHLIEPDGTTRPLESDGLYEALASLGLRAQVGALLGVERTVRGAERARLARCGAVAADMESPWLAAGAGGRPLAVLRVVVDGPGHELLRPSSVPRALRALWVLGEAVPALRRWAALQRPQPVRTHHAALG